jgi:hypothetical protein
MNAKAMWMGVVGCFTWGCATVAPRAELARLEDAFKTDQSAVLSEEALHQLVDGPVFLPAGARVGVLQVGAGYDRHPTPPPEVMNGTLERSGVFDATTEVATDWPTDAGVAGLRQLAARYRVGYLLLYRQRFVEKTWWNGWGWLAPTLIGALVAPNQTLATDGVLEATLFDVRSGTLLFTVYERVHASQNDNVWHDDDKLEAMELALIHDAATRLADDVVAKAKRLAALRPAVAERNPGS